MDFKHVLTEFPLLKGISSSTKRKCEGRLPGTVGTMPVGVKRYSYQCRCTQTTECKEIIVFMATQAPTTSWSLCELIAKNIDWGTCNFSHATWQILI